MWLILFIALCFCTGYSTSNCLKEAAGYLPPDEEKNKPVQSAKEVYEEVLHTQLLFLSRTDSRNEICIYHK